MEPDTSDAEELAKRKRSSLGGGRSDLFDREKT